MEVNEDNQNDVVQNHEVLLDRKAPSGAEEASIAANQAKLSFTQYVRLGHKHSYFLLRAKSNQKRMFLVGNFFFPITT